MERQEGFRAEIGKTTYFNGFKIEAYQVEESFPDASDTALHEAKHVVAGIDDGAIIEKVSIIPGRGYLGITQFNRFTASGAAAPHADGHSGTSWDVYLIESHKESVDSSGARGRRSILRNAKHVKKVAQELDKRGTLTGPDVTRIYQELEAGEEIRIDITAENGMKNHFETRSNNLFVMIPNQELFLSS